LETLPDDAQILIIDNNTAKRISKANAKFGGGAMVVTFTVTRDGVSADKTIEEVTTAMANMPVIGNLVLSQADTVTTIHLGACCAEFANSEIPTPAFGPFAYDSKDSRILGFVGVDSNGQWTVRMG
jgi:hypothetical protein